MDNRPIGVFDSGLGGLTATEELSGLLPDEHIIYLGDSYNMPYGEKGKSRIIEMSLNNLRFLLNKNVKAIIVACGTSTSNAIDVLVEESPVPVIGVVESAVREAVTATNNRKIGLIATSATIAAGAFQRTIQGMSPDIFVTANACPKFVPMIENGIFDKEDKRVIAAVAEYLPPLKKAGVDTVILGCTHYPLLTDVISEYMGEGVSFISAGAAAARSLCRYLRENGLTSENRAGKAEYYTSGSAKHFAATAELMLRRDISPYLRGIEPFDKKGNI